jgi:hypothetical protein
MGILISKKRYTIFVFFAQFLFLTCKKFEPFTIQKQDINTNNLKIDGYYYNLSNNQLDDFFLYKNGIYFGGADVATTRLTNLTEIDLLISQTYDLKVKNPVRYSYGLFNITNNEIKIERWLSGTGGPYPKQTLIGEILSDSTIKFHTIIGDYKYNKNNSKKPVVLINKIFVFRKFSPKPDSTNKFIK